MKLPTEHFYFTKDERHGLYFIITCISLLIIGIVIFNKFDSPVYIDYKDVEFAGMYELNKPPNQEVTPINLDDKVDANEKALFDFDPNRMSKDSLSMLPLSEKVVNNLLKYREKGGQFRKKEDLRKIYGMEGFYEKIAPYIAISSESPNKKKQTQLASSLSNSTEKVDTLQKATPFENPEENTFTNNATVNEKMDSLVYKNDFEEEEEKLVLELNTANVYQLQLINGIGEYYAQKIVDYRNKIGGFLNVEQLQSVLRRKESYDKVAAHFTCNPDLIRKRSINTIQKDSLAYLPFVGFKKAAIAIRYRNNHFPLKGIDDLRRIRIFDEEELTLFEKYLSFEIE